jgi:pyruvate dehydrogenase E2 component (dihydrolipoamide acetyltransferase)
MPTTVIMPALELAQETGKVLKWLKRPGDRVTKGEPIVEIETDKVTVEVEAPAAGVLRDVTAQAGDVVPVGQAIALIFAAGETGGGPASAAPAAAAATSPAGGVKASPLARRVAEQHGVDLATIKTESGRIEKADVSPTSSAARRRREMARRAHRRRVAEGRRLAAERGVDLRVAARAGRRGARRRRPRGGGFGCASPVATTGRGAARGRRGRRQQRLAHHGRAHDGQLDQRAALLPGARGCGVGRLITWRERASKQAGARITYTDLLVRLVAATIAQQPRVNASWKDGTIVQHADINIGLAVAIDDGLVVPVLPARTR